MRPSVLGLLFVGLLMFPWQVTQGVPITVTSQPIAPVNCEPAILPPTHVDELGTTVFPLDERITAAHSATSQFACQPDPVGSVEIRITNTVSPPIAFQDLWYVASHGTSFSNHEMLVEFGQAMKIDSLGPHQPLRAESITANNVFEPGEVWTFILDGWRNTFGFAPSQLSSPGIVGFTDTTSSGSIIAIPVPEPAIWWILLIPLAMGFKTLVRGPLGLGPVTVLSSRVRFVEPQSVRHGGVLVGKSVETISFLRRKANEY